MEVLLDVLEQSYFSEAVEVLREAGIPHHTFEGKSDFLYSMRQPEFKILVLHSDRERAERMLHDHFRTGVLARADLELHATDEFEPPTDSGMVPQKVIPENWDPEEATTEIWSGDDERFGLRLRDCLRENAIPSRCVLNDPGNSYVNVSPQDESRAREILREITEGKSLT